MTSHYGDVAPLNVRRNEVITQRLLTAGIVYKPVRAGSGGGGTLLSVTQSAKPSLPSPSRFASLGSTVGSLNSFSQSPPSSTWYTVVHSRDITARGTNPRALRLSSRPMALFQTVVPRALKGKWLISRTPFERKRNLQISFVRGFAFVERDALRLYLFFGDRRLHVCIKKDTEGQKRSSKALRTSSVQRRFFLSCRHVRAIHA
ncbi:hypothetical protein NDU88_001187 [Pleurodeles waltl]|uniref:Uncharacterized protein n=1 Tax=Pleurodeles waltl TaxID=8319 RepID=A0AAV7P612_PLEWA|nr:hypothetical protein NDU88_001187 [Pleurodeles waltl]